jgi:DNA-binding response OmpR family regulator
MTSNAAASAATPGILIVDDAVENLRLLTAMLRERGYEPRPVPNGKLALRAAQVDPPDLILLDIKMPEMDGFEVCARLKANTALRDIPVIFLSGFAEPAEKLQAFSLGAVDYVTKPFQVEEVEARVRTHVALRSLQRQLKTHNEQLAGLVAERTRELAAAYEKLRDMDRLKADFLRIISHEIRTPANGVLGVGELLLFLCPDSADRDRYQRLFEDSRARLLQLITDASLIADLEQLTVPSASASPCSLLLADVRAALPHIQLSAVPAAALDAVCLQGDYALLRSALTTLIRLASFFSRDKHTVQVTGDVTARHLRWRIELDACKLSPADAASFFELGSAIRSSSSAESLGLSPVVAQRILAAFGGEVRLIAEEPVAGTLEILLRRQDCGTP